MARIGLQLYTVRAECDRDLEGTLRRVGEIGYDGVELFRLHGHDPGQVRRWLDDAGLVAIGRHAGLDVLERELPALAAEVAVLGTDRVVLSWIRPGRRAVAQVAAVARAARDAGLSFGFHNHGAELKTVSRFGRKTFLDLLRELPPELLWLELDLGWVWHGGADPVAELEQTAGRCPVVHVKDFVNRSGRADVPVGDGAVGYERVVPAALRAGAEWLVVEQDEVEGPPFAAVERSLAAVRRLLAGA